MLSYVLLKYNWVLYFDYFMPVHGRRNWIIQRFRPKNKVLLIVKLFSILFKICYVCWVFSTFLKIQNLTALRRYRSASAARVWSIMSLYPTFTQVFGSIINKEKIWRKLCIACFTLKPNETSELTMRRTVQAKSTATYCVSYRTIIWNHDPVCQLVCSIGCYFFQL